MRPFNFIVSPCGTSMLRNLCKDQNQEQARLINDYANHKEQDLSPTDKQQLDVVIDQAQQSISSLIQNQQFDELRQASAELNALLHFYNDRCQDHANDAHLLIHTDTYLGNSTALITQNALQQLGFYQVFSITAPGLATKNLTDFRGALAHLTRDLREDYLQPYQKTQCQIIFNLTGGFKSIQGFLQVLAMFYADESIYIFEGDGELLHIPKLAIRFDYEQQIQDNLTVMRRLASDLPVNEKPEANLDLLIMSVDDQYTLSEWGEAVVKPTLQSLYEQKLWPSPSDKIKFDSGLKKSVEAYPKKVIAKANETIDDLAKQFELGLTLKRSTYKKLAGNPVEGCDHEAYLDSDDARRLFGYFEGGVFVIKKLGEHL